MKMTKYKVVATVNVGNEVVTIENVFEAENEERALDMNEETFLPEGSNEDSWELVEITKLEDGNI